MNFLSLNMIEHGVYNEDTGTYEEGTRPVSINPGRIRAFYARKGDRPGSRITFSDGGGFAVRETPNEIGALLAAD
jgi:hypothetical protein